MQKRKRDERKREDFFDYGVIGKAIKEARLKRGLTREQAAALIPIEPRYLASIENNGSNPGLQIFYKLVTEFEVSVDQFFYPNSQPVKTTIRRQLDGELDDLCDKDLIVVGSVVEGIKKSKTM